MNFANPSWKHVSAQVCNQTISSQIMTKLYLIITLVLFISSAVAPLFGATYLCIGLFIVAFGFACAYLGRVEDAIAVYGRPVFW